MATKKKAAAKAKPASQAKKAPAPKAPAAEQKPIKEVKPGDQVSYTKDGVRTSAKVLIVHGGNALDLLVMPEDGPAFTIGSVPHESNKGNQKIYWNQ